ncbi:hypothetical protein SAMN04515647_3568 [Cohaesibacter sp. ES.047]|nr:hypothetical protein SAMN04515647_3568 [Cohaesibacter sp. ES.047]
MLDGEGRPALRRQCGLASFGFYPGLEIVAVIAATGRADWSFAMCIVSFAK